MARDFGSVCFGDGAWTWSWLLLEIGANLGGMPRATATTPSPLSFLVPRFDPGQAEDRTTTESFDSAAELSDRLQQALQGAWREISIDLPPKAPAWLGVAALDIGTHSGVQLWGFPPPFDAPRHAW